MGQVATGLVSERFSLVWPDGFESRGGTTNRGSSLVFCFPDDDI